MIKKEDYIKVNQEILGGLKSAIEHGADLKEAMMGFYRSGYNKQEIEHAAKVYLDLENSSGIQSTPKKKEKELKPVQAKEEKKEGVKKEITKENEELKKEEPKKEEKKKKGLFGGKLKSKTLEKEEEQGEEVKIGNDSSNEVFKKEKGKIKKGGFFKRQKDKQTKQKVSAYDIKSKKPPQGKTITIVLILVLLFLLGILASVVLFREELVVFFNSLFG